MKTRAIALSMLVCGLASLSGCATTTSGTTSDIQQLQNIRIVRVATPPLTRNTWTGSFVKLYPSLLTAVVDAQTNKPQGLVPPYIPDFGAILASKMNTTLAAKPWWHAAEVVSEPIISGATPPDGNTLLIELEKMVISGGGQFVTVARFRLLASDGNVLWDTRSSYNGLFSGKGDNIDTRLLKGKAAVEEEFDYAAAYVLQPLLERLP